MKKVVLWGASGHAKVIMSQMDAAEFKVIGLVDRNKSITTFNGIPVYNNFYDFLLKNSSLQDLYFIIAVGGDKGRERIEIHNNLVEQGLKPLTFIHPNAWIDKTATIMAGAQVLGMAAISAEVVIGTQTIVNTNATVDHESRIGDGCHIMPAATVTGCCVINNYCTIGSNATILPRIELFEESIIGAGAVVTKSTKKKGVFFGIPAKEVQLNKSS